MFQPWTPTHKECSNYLVRGPHRRDAALLVHRVGDRVELGLALGGDLAAPASEKYKPRDVREMPRPPRCKANQQVTMKQDRD